MYDIENLNFTHILRNYRKSRNLTLSDLGNKLGKSKSTIAKYENGTILPDILTILEICNALNISLSQLFPLDYKNINISYSNPFHTDKLYFYYYTEDILIKSVMEIMNENNQLFVKFYNGILNYDTYTKDVSYYYEGTLECNHNIGYINLTNPSSQSTLFEKLQISFLVPWTQEFSTTNFFILALTPNSLPVVKRGIISSKIINDLSRYQDILKIGNDELKNIQNNNAWILKNKNYNSHFLEK